MSNSKPRRIKLGKRTFLLLESLGTHGGRYKARDLDSSPGGDLRVVYALPRSKRTHQHIQALRRVSEHNRTLPSILGYHPVKNKIYLVLPWIKGSTLADYLKRCQSSKKPGLSAYHAVQFFYRFAHGLTKMHHANIIHGDLKPQNIIISRPANELTLIDFGSAWLVEKTSKRSEGDGSLAQYTAPELHNGTNSGNPLSDQYSAFVIFYKMLTYELPFDDEGGNAGVDPDSPGSCYEPPSTKNRDRKPLPPRAWKKIDNMVKTGLRLDPNNRYGSRTAWIRALRDVKSSTDNSPRPNTFNRGVMDFLSLFSRKIGIWR